MDKLQGELSNDVGGQVGKGGMYVMSSVARCLKFQKAWEHLLPQCIIESKTCVDLTTDSGIFSGEDVGSTLSKGL